MFLISEVPLKSGCGICPLHQINERMPTDNVHDADTKLSHFIFHSLFAWATDVTTAVVYLAVGDGADGTFDEAALEAMGVVDAREVEVVSGTPAVFTPRTNLSFRETQD